MNETHTINFGQRFTVKEGAWQRSSGGAMALDRPIAWSANYELSPDDISSFQELYKLLQSKDFESINSNLRMAVQRFNSATLRTDWRIELSDMVIIMEAIISNKNTSGKEFAQRVAILLGDSFKEREEICKEVSDIWEKRSKVWGVAHGGGQSGLENHEEILDCARRYTADCIMTVLELEAESGGLGNLLNKLDKKINESRLDIEFPD